MGCPNMWHKACLEELAYLLSNDKSIEHFVSMPEKELEVYVLEKRSQTNEKLFYYLAGMATDKVLVDVTDNGPWDALNAAACGISTFEDFIGIDEEMLLAAGIM